MNDLKNLMNVRQTTFNFCDRSVGVHTGILSMFESIEEALSNQLTINKNQYITFCGHSLGGAIAQFAAAYYGHMSNYNIEVSCHTFGAPRLGDKEFNRWLQDGATDIVNMVTPGDLIPLFPLTRNYCIDENTVIIDRGRIASKRKLNRNPFDEHDLDTYIEAIRMYSELQKAPKILI